jgi:hypothetical protein
VMDVWRTTLRSRLIVAIIIVVAGAGLLSLRGSVINRAACVDHQAVPSPDGRVLASIEWNDCSDEPDRLLAPKVTLRRQQSGTDAQTEPVMLAEFWLKRGKGYPRPTGKLVVEWRDSHTLNVMYDGRFMDFRHTLPENVLMLAKQGPKFVWSEIRVSHFRLKDPPLRADVVNKTNQPLNVRLYPGGEMDSYLRSSSSRP